MPGTGKSGGSAVVVVGSSNTDLVLCCRRLPRPGETLTGGQFARFAGGKGANQAVAAARAGATVAFVGARGDDEFGLTAAAGLRAEGVDTRYFRVKSGESSGVALILVGGAGRENLIAVARSANQALTAADVQAARSWFVRSGAVLAQLEIPLSAVTAAADLAWSLDKPFILTPAPVPERPLPCRLLRRVHTLVPNRLEAAALTGESRPARAAQALRAMGCRQVVITLGSRGAFWLDDSGCGTIAAPRVTPVDTVGAGDCFAGWLAVGLTAGLRLDAAVARAVKAAAISVTRQGAQPSMPRAAEVQGGPTT